VRCPKEIEDQEHEQVLPASGPRSSANAIAETPPDGPGSGSALRPAACTPSRSPAHRPAKTHSGTSRNTLTSANTPVAAHRTDGAAAG
jgi:hypothetical protein